MSKKIGKYKIGKHEHPKYTDSTIDILGDVTFSSASLQTIDGGSLTTTGILSASAGVIHATVTEHGTGGNVDLSNITSDHYLIISSSVTGSVKLPQATSDNVGMKIQVMIAAGGDGTEGGGITGSIGVTNSGTTTLSSGVISTYSTNAKVDTAFFSDGNAKVINLTGPQPNGDGIAKAGGAEGSIYKFLYQAADTIHVEAVGALGADGTVALTSDASSSVGLTF